MTARQRLCDRRQQDEREQHQRGVDPACGMRAGGDRQCPSPDPCVGLRVAVIVDEEHGAGQATERETGRDRGRRSVPVQSQ